MPRKTPAALIKQRIRQKPRPDMRFRRHKSFGKVTNVGVCSWFFDMFTLNELQVKTRRATNAEIERLVCLEFAHRDKLVRGLKDPDNPNCINLFRHKYNKGVLITRTPPVYLSVRYNHKGIAVDSRTGQVPLTKSAYLDLLAKYRLTFEDHANKDLYRTLPD